MCWRRCMESAAKTLEDRCAQRGIPNDRVLCGVCSIGGKQNITYMPEGVCAHLCGERHAQKFDEFMASKNYMESSSLPQEFKEAGLSLDHLYCKITELSPPMQPLTNGTQAQVAPPAEEQGVMDL